MGNWQFGIVGRRIGFAAVAAMMIASNAWAGTAVLSWDPNTESTLAGYRVYYGESRTYSQRVDVGNVTTYTVGGLLEGRTYYFVVTAYDVLGVESAFSSEVSKTIPDTTPPLLSSIAAGSLTSSGATISWVTNEPATSRIEYGLTTAYGIASVLDATLVTNHRVALSGLALGTLYHYRVRSQDAAGNSAVSGDATFRTASAADTTPPAISAVTASLVTATGATITWTTNEASDSQVSYGPTTIYGSNTPLNITMVTSHSMALTGLTASTTYHYRVASRDAAGNLANSADFTFTTAPTGTGTTHLTSLSTRGLVQTNSEVLVGGFIIRGTGTKQVLLRGFGPTLSDFGVTGVLADPMLALEWDNDNNSNTPAVPVLNNDNWRTALVSCPAPVVACGTPQAIINTGMSPDAYAPANQNRALDAALLLTLPPGTYTVKLSGVSNGAGVGLVGVDDVDTNQTAQLVNVSTRAFVGAGASAEVGGFIIRGSSNKRLLLRGFGPTLSNFGITGALANPTLDLYWDNDDNPRTPAILVVSNNDWGTALVSCPAPIVSCGTPTDIANTGLSANTYAPTNVSRGLDAALLLTLPPGTYTARLSGVGNGTGVGLIGMDQIGP